MSRWDVIIVGAGPAGSVTAFQLARQGLAVLLLERAAIGRAKVCGGCLNHETLRRLREVGLGDVPRRCGAVETHRLALRVGESQVTLPLRPGASVTRAALDAALVQRAAEAGAVVRDRASAALGEANGEARYVHIGNERLAARLVIAADGLGGRFCDGVLPVRVARRSYMGVSTVIDADAPRDAITMACGAGGYVGLARAEAGRASVAAALDPAFVRDRGGPGDAATAVLRGAGVAHGIANDAVWHGTGLLTRRRVGVAAERLFVIGDAAGYIEPFTGEGMAWALRGAQAVAPLAVRAVEHWDVQRQREWSTIYRRDVCRRQWATRLTVGLLRRHRVMHCAAGVLSGLPWLAAPLLHALDQRPRERLTT